MHSSRCCILKVENGAQIRSKDINDMTPLLQAAQCGFKDIVQYLLSIGMSNLMYNGIIIRYSILLVISLFVENYTIQIKIKVEYLILTQS